MRETNASEEHERALDKLYKVTVPMLHRHGRKIEAMAMHGNRLAQRTMQQHDALVKEFDQVIAEAQHTDAIALVAEIHKLQGVK